MTENEEDVVLALTEIKVEGFKSLRDPVNIRLGRLTLFAGANSSGKSSFMQPLLLLKQTYDPSYDPGPLWLGGPNVTFSDVDQLFWIAADRHTKAFMVALQAPHWGYDVTFVPNGRVAETHPLRIAQSTWQDERRHIDWVALKPGMSSGDLIKAFATYSDQMLLSRAHEVDRQRAALVPVENDGAVHMAGPWSELPRLFRQFIHVPGLRGNPERTYKRISSDAFEGLFQEYAASIIFRWQQEKSGALSALEREMRVLGLTGRVDVRAVSATELELSVGRLPDSDAQDVVSIADVGFGVSQVLPVIVGLLAAKPGQLVYLEQPELHLHPRAQVTLAEVIARAVERGVQVVAETHSELLLLGVQRLVAESKLDPDWVRLHWFERDEEGVTRVSSTAPNAEGAFGDWPVDFADVSMSAMRAYIDAVAAKHRSHV